MVKRFMIRWGTSGKRSSIIKSEGIIEAKEKFKEIHPRSKIKRIFPFPLDKRRR